MTIKATLPSLEYLDPSIPNRDRKLVVPTIDNLRGKRVAFVNNGWRSFTRIGERLESRLKASYGIAAMHSYSIPTAGAPEPGLFDRVVNECDVAVVGLAN